MESWFLFLVVCCGWTFVLNSSGTCVPNAFECLCLLLFSIYKKVCESSTWTLASVYNTSYWLTSLSMCWISCVSVRACVRACVQIPACFHMFGGRCWKHCTGAEALHRRMLCTCLEAGAEALPHCSRLMYLWTVLARVLKHRTNCMQWWDAMCPTMYMELCVAFFF